MNVSVCFYFESTDASVYAGRTVDLQEWRESLKILGCTDLYVINSSGKSIDFQDDYVTLHEVTELPAGDLIYCDPNGGVGLIGFVHPADPIYVIGPDSSGLNLDDYSEAVAIPSTNEYTETWGLCAANIVLYDRISKLA